MSLSPDERLYLFANWYLWAIFPIFLYLEEEGALEGAQVSMHWVDACEQLADWAATESAHMKPRAANQEEQSAVYQTGVDLADTLTEHLRDELIRGAGMVAEEHPSFSKAQLVHEHYASFLVAVLNEYRELVHGLHAQSELYEPYRENVGLFDTVIHACQVERAFFDRPAGVSREQIEKLLAGIDTFAARLATEWRGAVLGAVQP